MYFHKPQEKPRKWGSFQDVQYAVMKNCEKIYGVDPDSIVLAMPLFWGLPPLDYSGKNNHGTNHGATYKDGSLDFDGVNDYVDAGDGASPLGWTEETVSIWLNRDVFASWKSIISFYNDNTYYHRFANAGSSNRVVCYFGDNANNLEYLNFENNKWFRITMTVRVNDYARLYVNGTEITTKSVGASILADTDGRWIIGNRGIGVNSFFNGSINEVRISNVVRTADQIALFHDLPWALYQPVSRPVYFFQAAAGEVTMPIFMSNYLRQMGA